MAPLLVVPSRSTRRLAAARLFGLAALALAPSARADLGPPPGWVDCTLEARRAKGDECLACGASARDPERCSRALSAYGFEWACRQDRASIVWTELWCRAPRASSKKVPAEILDDLANASAGAGAPSGSSAPSAALSASASAPAASAPGASAPGASAPLTGAASEPLSTPPPVPRPASGCGACAAGALDGGGAAALWVALAAALAALARRLQFQGGARR